MRHEVKANPKLSYPRTEVTVKPAVAGVPDSKNNPNWLMIGNVADKM